MSDTKWADVAHYYLQSPIVLSDDEGNEYDRGIAVNSNRYYRCTPILRHLDDMTEAEVLECIKCGWPDGAGKPIKEFACIPDHSAFGSAFAYKIVFDGSPHYMAGTMSFRSLNGNQFLWLISRGFDVFGLIESGQAIRKEAGNGL